MSIPTRILPLLLASALISQGQTLWTGASDSDWFNAANWDNGVPTSGNNATFSAGTATINTDTGGYTINQNGGTIDISDSNFQVPGDSVWNINGGALNATGTVDAAGTDVAIHVAGGALDVGGQLDLSTFQSPDFTLSSGSVTADSVFVNRRTSFVVSGGTLTTSTFDNAYNAGLAGNSNYDVRFSGGVSSLGDIRFSWANSTGRGTRMTIDAGDAVISGSSLLFAPSTGGADSDGASATYIDFSSSWTGSFDIAGASSITDYWNLFDTVDGTFVRYDGAAIDETTFGNVFTVNGAGALTAIPEPSHVSLLAALTALWIARRRRQA